MINRNAHNKSDLSVIGKLRDEGIFSMKVLTASPTKKRISIPKASINVQNVKAKPKKSRATLRSSRNLKLEPVLSPKSKYKDEIRKEEQRRRQFVILSERRERLAKEKKERLKREVELLKLKAKEGKKARYLRKHQLTKVTAEEVKKLEKLVRFIGKRTDIVNNSPNLFISKLAKIFAESINKDCIMDQFITEVASKKHLFKDYGIPALTRSGCIICGGSNVKVS